MSRDSSHNAFQTALSLMPGGVNSPARAFGGVGGEPLFIERADGPYLFDIDGNQYIDYIGSWGPMILGHNHPAVLDALRTAISKGTSYGAPTVAENDLAQLVVEAIPSVEKVRLVNSGTEATMSAVRLARGYTGRDLIVKFAGNYHGHVDSLLVAAGSSAATLAVPDSPGVTAGTSKDTLILEFNDGPALADAFAEHGQRIAGVIMEPFVGNMGFVPASVEFAQQVRELTSQHGALLIFDEVMTGFRVAYGGAQSLLEVTPDLTTMGKIIGGGMPIGAYGGSRDIMDAMLPAGRVFQAGTLSGNPLATAVGIATLTTLRDGSIYEELERKSATLADGIAAAAANAGVEHCLQRVGSMMTLFFHGGPVRGWNDASQSDKDKYGRYFWEMMNRGVYLPCSQYEALFVSAAHSDDDIQKTVEAASESLAAL